MVTNYTPGTDWQRAMRDAEHECKRMTWPGVAVGMGLSALFILGTVLAIVLGGA